MKQLLKQYSLTTYADGSVRLTERAMPKRGWHGQFARTRPTKPTIIRAATCPACGAEIGLVEI